MKDKEFYHEFHFGRKETTRTQYAIIGVALDFTIAVLLKLGFSQEKAMRFVHEIVRTFKLDRVNDYVIRDEEWLDVRVDADVEEALEDFKGETNFEPVETAEVVITEVEEGETLLGGELRATYDFVIEDENN